MMGHKEGILPILLLLLDNHALSKAAAAAAALRAMAGVYRLALALLRLYSLILFLPLLLLLQAPHLGSHGHLEEAIRSRWRISWRRYCCASCLCSW